MQYKQFFFLIQNKVNLLSKLKDRIDIESTNTTETIKSLVHLPKAWANEAIEKRANESGDRKRKQKQQVENSVDSAEKDGDDSVKKLKLFDENNVTGKGRKMPKKVEEGNGK